jgi:hypothetical protein
LQQCGYSSKNLKLKIAGETDNLPCRGSSSHQKSPRKPAEGVFPVFRRRKGERQPGSAPPLQRPSRASRNEIYLFLFAGTDDCSWAGGLCRRLRPGDELQILSGIIPYAQSLFNLAKTLLWQNYTPPFSFHFPYCFNQFFAVSFPFITWFHRLDFCPRLVYVITPAMLPLSYTAPMEISACSQLSMTLRAASGGGLLQRPSLTAAALSD